MLRSLLLLAAVAALPAMAAAQGTARPQVPVVPPHLMPPAGKCRIWMDGVTPTQQPAPTDCQTALRQKPANGTVIFGPSERDLEAAGFRSNPRPSRRDTLAALPSRGRAAPRAPSDTTKPPATRRPEPTS
ncbi:MAG: hypothetical protein C0503_03935 [Gemmatimonas sp.]|nr:hypothetical protein [Gemmatimonas sp.]